jgi:Mg2+-importing ATPase
MSVDVIGFVLTVTPLGRKLGFAPLPWQFYAALAVFIVTYLVLVEAAKKVFYSEPMRVFGQPNRTRGLNHRIQRRAARFIHSGVNPRVPRTSR